MNKKKSLRKKTQNHIKSRHTVRLKALIAIFSTLFLIDGTLRILASFHLFSSFISPLAPDQFGAFRLRWLSVGMSEIILAFGILDFKKWALYGLVLLSIVWIYTITEFPPLGFIYPLQRNMITYVNMSFGIAFTIYFFTKRKYFK